jgi:hypothetical protein
MKGRDKRELILLVVCVLLLVIVIYLILLDLWGLSLWGKTVDYTRFGTWSQAVSGIVTTVALIVALTSLLSQRSIHNRNEDRRLIEEETSIFLWLTAKELRDNLNNLVGRLWDVRIQNSTDAPVYHWKVIFDSNVNHLCNELKRPILPGENAFNLPFFDNLEPNKTPESSLIFEGRSGRIWTRSTRGILKQTTIKELDCPHSTQRTNSNSSRILS